MSNSRSTSRFRLEPVLEQRRRLTEVAQQTLAERSRYVVETEKSLRQLQQEQADLAKFIHANQCAGTVDIATLAAADCYEARLRHATHAHAHAMEEALGRETDARGTVLTRLVDQRVLEKLRERHARVTEARERAAESRTLDDISSNRAGMQRDGQGGGGNRDR